MLVQGTGTKYTPHSMLRRLWIAAALLALLLLPGTSTAQTEEETYTEQARQLLETLDSAARVGQLFVVAFEGNDSSSESAVATLISRYRVGGVFLRAANDNFAAAAEGTDAIVNLTNALQRQALFEPLPQLDGESTATPAPIVARSDGVPLFVAMTHDGDGPPYSELFSALGNFPSLMALGATWDPDLAFAVGDALGASLSQLGINMLLGPSLDVYPTPEPFSPGNIGVRTFGGSPYWVGELGRAYTGGIHTGSAGRVAVIGRNFPGQGGSDRPVAEEVAIMRKTVEQLRSTDLVPFVAVTDLARPATERVDGLMTTQVHIQGLQSTSGTRPLPFALDPQAISSLMALPEFAPWRGSGGLTIADTLGNRTVRLYYDETETAFPHRQVAKDALLAGNDALIVDDFGALGNDYAQQVANIVDTILWFQERYATDIAFSQRVDDAVIRILARKLALYDGDFSAENVLVPTGAPFPATDTLFLNLAQEAATLIVPGPEELLPRLGAAPGAGEQIVIFTDVRTARQCSTCPEQPYIDVSALQQRLLAIYGPAASNQISARQIQSFSFADLALFLDNAPIPPPPTPTVETLPDTNTTATPSGTQPPTPIPSPTTSPAFFVQEALAAADWILFAMVDVDNQNPESLALKRFLGERLDLIRNRQVVAFAFEAPNYLDTTEISNLAAYFALFGKTEPFIDVAMRALFLEQPLGGASPLDVPSINYRIEDVTKPDPNQVISLFIIQDPTEQEDGAGGGPLEVLVGETLRLSTGVILDANGNPVPDGTAVTFIQQDRVQGFGNVIAETTTVAGVAILDYLLEARTGNFRITVRTETASVSLALDLEINDETGGVVAFLSPTPTPTVRPSPTGTATPTAAPTRTPTPTLTPTPPAPEAPPAGTVQISLRRLQRFSSLLLGLLLVGGLGSALQLAPQFTSRRRRLQIVLVGLLAALVSNVVLSLLPAASDAAAPGLFVGIMFAAGAIAMALLWWRQP